MRLESGDIELGDFAWPQGIQGMLYLLPSHPLLLHRLEHLYHLSPAPSHFKCPGRWEACDGRRIHPCKMKGSLPASHTLTWCWTNKFFEVENPKTLAFFFGGGWLQNRSWNPYHQVNNPTIKKTKLLPKQKDVHRRMLQHCRSRGWDVDYSQYSTIVSRQFAMQQLSHRHWLPRCLW